MLDILDNYNETFQKHKLLLTLNGDLDSAIFPMEFSLISMADIKKKAEQVYNIELDKLRLFTQQGVEIFEEDLMFLKDSSLLYISDCNISPICKLVSSMHTRNSKMLGEGGFGKVLLGKHKLTQELVAIKIIDSGKLWNAADIDLVFREAEVMKNLRHKNIIKILNCYTLPTMQVVLIMEFLEGGDLVDYIQSKGRLSEDEARVIFKQIAEAICYCHDQKLIHRDLKLENILLTSKTEKQIKIIDFGIATVANNFRMDKIDLGSLSYMPPEVLSGQVQQIRPSIDIWALGVILYALVCGNLPFNKPLQEQTVSNIIRCNYQFPNIALSKEYKDLVQLMLNPDPEERYSAYEVLGHIWMKRTGNTLQTPLKLFPKGVIKRDYTKLNGPNNNNGKKLMQQSVVITRDFTCLAQGKSSLSLKTETRGGWESPNLIICESPSLVIRKQPAVSIKQFDSPKGTQEIIEMPESVQEQVSVPSPKNRHENRKYSNFNQKLIDRIFKEDTGRKKKIISQCVTHALNSPKHTSKDSIDHIPQSVRLHSKQSSLDMTKRVKSKQVKLRTIINLSHLTDLKQLYAGQLQKKQKKQITFADHMDTENLYKLQLSFRHRKMHSDQLLQKTFRSGELRISDLYSTLFRV